MIIDRIKASQSRNDLSWCGFTPDTYERIWWWGYDDTNWWTRVYPSAPWRRAKDKGGRVWILADGEQSAALEAA